MNSNQNNNQKRLPKESNVKEIFFDYIRDPAFKRLLNQIIISQEEENFKSIAVISEYPGEGKTFFISVLALGLASFLKKRVLIMDTISQTRNESFYISSVLENEQVIQDEDSDDSNRGVIDLITTKNLRRQAQQNKFLDYDSKTQSQDEQDDYDTADFQIGKFIKSLTPSYDIILLDTCSLSEVTKVHLDPIILAHQADAAILITSKHSIKSDVLTRIKKELKSPNIRLIGTIYNSNI